MTESETKMVGIYGEQVPHVSYRNVKVIKNKFCKSGTRYFSRFNRDKVFSFYKIYPYLNKIESVDVESVKRIWFSIGVWY